MKTHHYQSGQVAPGIDSSLLAAHHVDEHLVVDDGLARCSLWWTSGPKIEGQTLGIVGHFQASSLDAGIFLLNQARHRLREVGCTLAIGPMDGNTWHRYRVLTDRGTEPPFFLEPDNPADWPQIFESAGFLPLTRYSSTLVTDLARRDDRAQRARDRIERDGITIRHLDPGQFAGDLRRIYEVSVVSFTGNYLYTEQSEEDFLDQYLPYEDKIRPELVFLAEDQGKPVGYLFAVPDYAEALRGAPIRTVIGKTLAVVPGRRYAGLGLVLVDALHEKSYALGYARLIHALQHDGNNKVRNMSEFFGSIMRRYTLYSCSLT